MAIRYCQSNTFYLAGSGVVIGATSIVLTSFTDIYGNVLTMADFGTKGYGTLEPDTTNEEAFTFTGVVANANGTYTLTGVASTLAKSPYTETSGLVRGHAGGSKMVVTDNVAFWNTFTNKNNDETITGQWTFSVFPITPSVPLATTSVAGSVQLPTQAQVNAKTASGSVGPLAVTPDLLASILLSDYKIDTGLADAYVITPAPAITAYTAGQIFSFKAIHANTGASTLNVNGLGVKTIKKGSGATDLISGDIVVGQIVVVEYDGTNFQVLSNILATTTAVLRTYLNAASPATWTKPAGLKYVKVRVVGAGGGGAGTGSAANDSSAGSGAYSERLIAASSLGTTETVTIGAKGTGGASNTSGTDGGTSSFGAWVSCTGGVKGTHSGASGAGGTATNGDININGQTGTSVVPMGGSNPLGFGGIGAGGAATGYGGGGAGGNSSSGGNGSDGLVIVEEYYV